MFAIASGRIQSNFLSSTLVGVLLSALLLPGTAFAVPAFARQTGQSCVSCHAGGQYPELTPYGRLFKLTGYTIGTRDVPLSVMGVVNFNRTSNISDPNGDARADFPKDGTLKFDTGSFFIAGKVNDNIGAFVQITYNNYDGVNPNDSSFTGHSSSDQFDLRYADRFVDGSRDLIVGMSLNNNPGVQDVWNSSHGGFGYNVVPGSTGPAVAPLIAGGLAQNVAGIGAYVYCNKMVYAELSAYRTGTGVFSIMTQGFHPELGSQQILKGENPYWRVAVNRDWGPHNLMVGAFGLNAQVYDDPTDPSGATTHRFRDIGVDTQYQYLTDLHTVVAYASFVTENHHYPDTVGNQPAAYFDALGNPTLANTNSSDTLNMLRAKVSYVYRSTYGGSLSYFNITGTTNTLNQTAGYDDTGTFVPFAGPGGNVSGNPATRGWTPERFWTPVQYLRLGMQYTAFSKFNGASNNYDGAGRNARDNNTLFFYAWGAF